VATKTAPLAYSKSFRRALQRVITKQLTSGRVNPKSAAAEELFARGNPDDVLNALLETVAMLATDDRAGADPIDRIDHALAHLGQRKLPKNKR
jgi:hypothetical protein